MKQTRNLFVYGTLSFPEIVKALSGKEFSSDAAVLNNYSVRKLKDKPYPGLIESPGDKAKGVVMFNVDEETYKLIRDWEDDEYCETMVKVYTSDKTKLPVPACTFVWQGSGVLDERWDKSFFAKQYLDEFVKDRVLKYLASK